MLLLSSLAFEMTKLESVKKGVRESDNRWTDLGVREANTISGPHRE